MRLRAARGLTLTNRAHLMDAFGDERRTDPEVAVRTLMTMWTGTLAVDA